MKLANSRPLVLSKKGIEIMASTPINPDMSRKVSPSPSGFSNLKVKQYNQQNAESTPSVVPEFSSLMSLSHEHKDPSGRGFGGIKSVKNF